MLQDIDVHLVNSVAEASDLIEWINQPHEVIAFDLETTGLDPRDPGSAIRLAQLGDYQTGWAVPWQGWGGVFLEALCVWQGPLVGHNTAFDNRWLQMYADWKPPFERLHDTMIMAQICEPDKRSGLKDLGDRYVDRRASVGQKLLKQAMKEQNWGWDTVPADFEIYWTYGALDPIITAHIYKHFRADLKYPDSYDLEMNARRVVSAMEDNGIRIDLPYCEEQIVKLHDYVDSSKQWAEDNWNINIASASQVVDFFQNQLQQEFTVFTESGSPSTNIEQMEKFIESENELAAAAADFIVSIRKASKKADSYFKNFINFQHDGILHTSFKTLQARTGRMSSTKPALQTISKSDPVLRDAFLPHEGQVLLSCDYSQIELRLMCHFSGDEKLAEAFRTADATGGDFFVQMGREIYRDEGFTKKDPRRNLIKTFVYAFLYGAGIPKMAKSAQVSVTEMQDFVDTLSQTYPGIPKFQEDITRIGEMREQSEGQGYIITPYGKRIPCDEGQARTLVNYLLQGHASEILKSSLVKLDAAGLTPFLLLPIHDEVVASVPEDDYKEIADQISEIMTIKDQYAVDLIADAEGPFRRWGDKVRSA